MTKTHNLNIYPSLPTHIASYDGYRENLEYFAKLIYVKEGALFAIVSDVFYFVPQNQLILLHRDAPYSVWSAPNMQSIFYKFSFDSLEDGQDIFIKHALLKDPFAVYVPDDEVTRIFDLSRNAPVFSHSMSVRIHRAAQSMMLCSLYLDARARTESALSEYADVISYMKTHLAENISIDALADIMHQNRSYFCTHFGKRFGVSPIRYLTHLRISEASQLIRKTDMPFAEIAERIGVENVYYFKNFFLHNIGITPEKFRQLSILSKI